MEKTYTHHYETFLACRRFDVRGRPFTQALMWSDLNYFGPRAYFVTGKRPVAALQLESVSLKDAGNYRCRVDFRNSPTRNFQVKLTVIVPPNKLLVYDNSGRELSDVVGPLTEGSDLVLTCEVRGGEPTPTVSWFINDKLVQGRVETVQNNVVVNKLDISKLLRSHLNTTYKCQASNTKLMTPTEKTVRLEMFLKPTSVELLTKPIELVADEEYSISCEARGSRPQAELTWLRENRKFKRGKMETWSNESAVSSKVTFSPTPEDDGHVLKCQAINPSIPAAPLEDFLTLNVVYSPLVTLQLGSSLRPQQIKEGDDVYFECDVRANPRQHKINWYHNAIPISQNMSSGVLFSTQSLVLQGVTRLNSGEYTCVAANTRGHTSSRPVKLRVQYAPVCAASEPVIVGASLEEAVRVKCAVSADPAELTFLWQFNNSGESFPVAPTRYATSNYTMSELVYTPSSERDYGTLACWASNSIGRQIDPCTFQVVPATKPGQLHNCTLRSTVNTTGDWLEIECIAGFDGGLLQTFHLEAIDSATAKYCLNATNSEGPFFRVELAALTNGHPGTIQLIIYAANQKGRSEVVVLEDIAIRDAEKRTEWVGSGRNLGTGSLAVLLVAGFLSVAAVLVALTICALRRRSYRMQHTSPTPTKQIEITQGDDQRYVVSYQLKPETKQPDILNRVTDEPHDRDPLPLSCTGPGVTATFISPCGSPNGCVTRSVSPSQHTGLASTGTGAITHSSTLSSTQHIISNSIPGPESCV
ncbi:CD80-like C2-set immunoglobulin domain [Nesidiocoris tenuis]|uniref:CD80-like C2-set immunoglobulin domain n=1 Tax=Nesidiocoris tenuis TaxID=355587 RepID=A0ABN7AJX6_9HEMI|nr:CD80-like C2-set immunoglobulin domain [Nesidiocoris tenuis]